MFNNNLDSKYTYYAYIPNDENDICWSITENIDENEYSTIIYPNTCSKETFVSAVGTTALEIFKETKDGSILLTIDVQELADLVKELGLKATKKYSPMQAMMEIAFSDGGEADGI